MSEEKTTDRAPSLEHIPSLQLLRQASGWGAEEGWDELGDFVDDAADIREATVPEHVKKIVEDTLAPLSLIDRFSQYRIDYPNGLQIRIRLSFPIRKLPIAPEQAQAWGLDFTKLVVLELAFDMNFLDQPSAPAVAVGQAASISHALEPFRMSTSMTNMVREQFFGNKKLEKLPDPEYESISKGKGTTTSTSPKEGPKFDLTKVKKVMDTADVSFFLAMDMLRTHNNDVPKAVDALMSQHTRVELTRQSSTNQEHAMHDRKVAAEENDRASLPDKLRAMTTKYNVPASVIRLAMSLESTDAGLDALLSNPESLQQLMAICDESTFQSNFPNFADDVKELHERQEKSKSSSTSTAASGSKEKKDKEKEKERERTKDSENTDPEAIDVACDASETWADGGRYLGVSPDQLAVAAFWVKYNHLVRLVLFIERRILEANRFCLICCKPMEFEGLKPAVCSRNLCTMAFEDLGIGFNLATEIRENPEVADLLITFAYSACLKNTMHFIVPINCTAKNPETGKEETFRLPAPVTKNTNSNAQVQLKDDAELLNQPRLMECLNACPSVKDLCVMAEQGQAYMKQQLNKLDVLLYPLLRWIFTSTRAHLRPLKPHERVKEIPSKAQFALLSSTPEREARFQRLKHGAEIDKGQGKGSIYAWHGSSTSNWHSIMRTGLKNLSNTSLMTTGAAYGAGIYMAVESQTSIGYCRDGSAWPKSMFGRSFKCLCLCELVNHKNLPNPNPYYVIQQEGWITTRFFFVIDESSSFHVQAADLANKVPKLGL